ncbi:unnamed protein product [Echinostoma caproni]|uniref:UPF0506 domain-containing protein n=1 Tax=Echinostoma caproni TaxID=27848 RepID=A0A183ACC4_9TREM|nr:unnamed protein product [Echinostoma caproni]VDP90105.1 unnamed protein product [Echinostoma caproni]
MLMANPDAKCVPEKGECDKTVFHRCCDKLVCDLERPGKGVCIECYPDNHLCMKDDECCSKQCKLFKCKPKPAV